MYGQFFITNNLRLACALLRAGHGVMDMAVYDFDIVSCVEIHFSLLPVALPGRRPKSDQVALERLARFWIEHFDGDDCQFADGILLPGDGTVLRGAPALKAYFKSRF